MYREYIPHDNSSQYLEAVWFSKNETKKKEIKKTVLPDNCSDIIIPLNGKREPFFVGHMTSFLIHKASPDEELLGLRFKPGYSAAFIKGDMSQLTDKRIDLSSLFKNPFEQIQEEYLKSETILLDSLKEILSEIYLDFTQDPHIGASIELIRKASGNIRVEQISESLGLSRRMLEKKFKQYLGKTPKRFARIERFNALMKNPDHLHYYDQSHMIKEFKMFTGVTPTDFFPGK